MAAAGAEEYPEACRGPVSAAVPRSPGSSRRACARSGRPPGRARRSGAGFPLRLVSRQTTPRAARGRPRGGTAARTSVRSGRPGCGSRCRSRAARRPSGIAKVSPCHWKTGSTAGRPRKSGSASPASVRLTVLQPTSSTRFFVTARAGGLRDHLGAEADAEHRQVARGGLLQKARLVAQERVPLLLVDVHRPAHRERGVELPAARGARRRGAAGRPGPRRPRPASRSPKTPGPSFSTCMITRTRIDGQIISTVMRFLRTLAPSRRSQVLRPAVRDRQAPVAAEGPRGDLHARAGPAAACTPSRRPAG